MLDNNNNIDNSLIFFKIWRNLVIKNKIVQQLKLYNLLGDNKFGFKNLKAFDQYTHKQYLNSISLIINRNDIKEIQDIEYILSTIPTNIKKVSLKITNSYEINNNNNNYNNNNNNNNITIINVPKSIETFKIFEKNNKIQFIFQSNSQIKCINYNNRMNRSIKDCYSSESIVKLILPRELDFQIEPGYLPPALEFLKLPVYYNHPIKVGTFPASLKHLEFSKDYNHPITKGIIPCNLVSLKFGETFDQQIEPGSLPNSITSLDFHKYDGSFNQLLTIDMIPTSLTNLVFSNQFNQDISNVLVNCQNIKSIQFGFYFNQSIDCIVNFKSITNLYLNPVLSNCENTLTLPSELQEIENYSPENLDAMQTQLSPLDKLDKMDLSFNFRSPIALFKLPNVKTINMGCIGTKLIANPQGEWQSNLHRIKFGMLYDYEILPSALPSNLKQLVIEGSNQKPTKDWVPKLLETLVLFKIDNSNSLEMELPTSLKSLRIAKKCIFKMNNQQKNNVFEDDKVFDNFAIKLPNSITHLDIIANTKQPLSMNWLPPNIKYLTIRNLETHSPPPPPPPCSSLSMDSTYESSQQLFIDKIDYFNSYQLPNSLQSIFIDKYSFQTCISIEFDNDFIDLLVVVKNNRFLNKIFKKISNL